MFKKNLIRNYGNHYTITKNMSFFIFECIKRTCRRLQDRTRIIENIVSKNLSGIHDEINGKINYNPNFNLSIGTSFYLAYSYMKCFLL
jgi:hypothetical protein